jgi:hypothetical protein
MVNMDNKIILIKAISLFMMESYMKPMEILKGIKLYTEKKNLIKKFLKELFLINKRNLSILSLKNLLIGNGMILNKGLLNFSSTIFFRVIKL